MRRIKVLHLITNLQVGGATDNTLMTVAGLRRDRYEVHLGAGISLPDEQYTEWHDRARECADTLYVVDEMRRRLRPGTDLMALRALTNLIKRENYDIVHTHCSKAGFLGRIAARRARSPIVVHTYHAFGYQVTARASKSLVRRGMLSLARSAYLQLDRYTASLSDALITVCDLNRTMAIDLKLAPSEKVTTIHSGIELSNHGPPANREEFCRSLGLDPERPIVGTVGRLAVQKDPLTFVRAAKLVLEHHPEAQFVMVGDGPLAAEVQNAIGGETRIRSLGYRDDVSDILSVLDVFALSSRWEGLGRALTEAIGAGVPVAATAVDGIPELVTHDVTGKLSTPGEAAPLADNIAWILENQAEAARMADRARKRVVEEWGVDRMVQQIDDLYERLMAERGWDAGATASNPAVETSANLP